MRPVEITERPVEVITLTERAAVKIRDLLAEEPEGGASVLRVAVQGGGCSGFEYALGFDSGAQEGDHELSVHGVPIVVDPYSAPYLQGTEIDFLDGLQAGFAINNPNVTAACGCGHSFQVAEGEEPDADAGASGCGSGCSH
jgi:iron-sulfur cluster assembly protein